MYERLKNNIIIKAFWWLFNFCWLSVLSSYSYALTAFNTFWSRLYLYFLHYSITSTMCVIFRHVFCVPFKSKMIYIFFIYSNGYIITYFLKYTGLLVYAKWKNEPALTGMGQIHIWDYTDMGSPLRIWESVMGCPCLYVLVA